MGAGQSRCRETKNRKNPASSAQSDRSIDRSKRALQVPLCESKEHAFIEPGRQAKSRCTVAVLQVSIDRPRRAIIVHGVYRRLSLPNRGAKTWAVAAAKCSVSAPLQQSGLTQSAFHREYIRSLLNNKTTGEVEKRFVQATKGKGVFARSNLVQDRAFMHHAKWRSFWAQAGRKRKRQGCFLPVRISYKTCFLAPMPKFCERTNEANTRRGKGYARYVIYRRECIGRPAF